MFIPLTRLCRDRCHYCTFVTVPGRLPAAYLSPDEILEIARQGAALGCKEALFTLGDRPEDRWPQAREWLDSHGYDSTLAYLRAMAIRVLEETGLLPHLNPGVMSWQEMQRLKPVAPSMGMMLETTSTAIFTEPGRRTFRLPGQGSGSPAAGARGRGTQHHPVHHRHPRRDRRNDRGPGRVAVRDPAKAARQYGAIQEVIVQNFLAKPDTAMRSAPDAGRDEYLAAIAVARVVLGPNRSAFRRRRTCPTRTSWPGCWPPASTTGVGCPR